MPVFSFTEKEWDKVRPSSVKKTGVSEAMRDMLKGVPKELKALADDKACDAAIKLLDTADSVLDKAVGLVGKAKDDKHDAAGKLKTWRAEVKDGKEMVTLHKEKQKYALANKATEVKFTGILNDVEKSITEAQKLSAQVLKDLNANKTVDFGGLTKVQQDFRGTQRSAREATSKQGAVKLVKFIDEVHKAGLDPKKVELPSAVIKKIEGKVDELETQIDALGDALSQAVEKQSAVGGTGPAADEARKLLNEYKASHKKIKALGGQGKKLVAAAKKANQAIHASKVADTSKYLDLIHKVHLASQQFEEEVLKESFRSRNKAGELAQKFAALKKMDGFDDKINQAIADWLTAIFDVVRTCTLPNGAAKDEIDDALAHVMSFGGATAGQAESQAKRITEERRALGNKYGSTGGGG